MATKEMITVSERYRYLRLVQERYWAADRKGRSSLLNELEEVTDMHRKSLIPLTRHVGRCKRQPCGMTNVNYSFDILFVMVLTRSTTVACSTTITVLQATEC